MVLHCNKATIMSTIDTLNSIKNTSTKNSFNFMFCSFVYGHICGYQRGFKKKIKAVSLISNFLDLLVIMELYVNAIPVMMMSTLDTH